MNFRRCLYNINIKHIVDYRLQTDSCRSKNSQKKKIQLYRTGRVTDIYQTDRTCQVESVEILHVPENRDIRT